MLTIYREIRVFCCSNNDMKNWIKLFFSFHVRDMSLLPSVFVVCFFFYSPFSLEGFLCEHQKKIMRIFLLLNFFSACFFFSGLYRLTSKTFFSRFVLWYGVAKPRAVLKFVEWVFFLSVILSQRCCYYEGFSCFFVLDVQGYGQHFPSNNFNLIFVRDRTNPLRIKSKGKKYNKKFCAVVEQDDFLVYFRLINFYQIFDIKPYIFICPIKRNVMFDSKHIKKIK